MPDFPVRVREARLFLSPHAIERYVERVKPHLTVAEARAELVRVLVHAEIVRPGPAWAGGEFQRFVLLGDGIGFPLQGRTLVSCVIRAGVGAEVRVLRSDRRRDERQRRRERASRPFGKAAKGQERARRDRRRARKAAEDV